jgi:hypothetical protein
VADPEDIPILDPADDLEDPEKIDDGEHPEDAQLPRLRSFKDVNLSVGQFLAGLEQKILHNRPPAAIIVEQEARGEQVETNGLVIGNLPVEPLEHPEPPDDSGVTL